MKLREIKEILESEGYQISKKRTTYIGFAYRDMYHIIGCKLVLGKSDYLNIPVMVHTTGFVIRYDELENFYNHNGEGFDTFTDIYEFIKVLRTSDWSEK